MLRSLTCLVCTFLFASSLPGQFFLNGNAIALNDSCYQLTSEVNWEVGSIWDSEKIDLRESFDLSMEVYLGCKDIDGADGLVFGLQPVSTTIGVAGGAIGFGGVTPALGVEVDTYQNSNIGDPAADHLAIIRDGILDHNTPAGSLAGPIQARVNSANIEDCSFYVMRITWDAPSQTMEVYFDCELRLSYTADIVNEIFNGDPLVFWGFTSATGGLNNIHQICLTYVTFFDQLEDKVMCPGGQVSLNAGGGVSYEWTPTTGLSNPFIPNPVASPGETTLYTVEIMDDCGRLFLDEALVTVTGDSTFFDLGPDTTLCEGTDLLLDVTTPTAVYQWSTGATTPTLLANYPGDFRVTVTRTDTICTSEDEVRIDYRPAAKVELGPDTTLCLEQEITLYAAFPGATTEWQNGARTDSLLVTTGGLYAVTLDHPCGIVTDQIQVDFEDCRQIYLPNAFSPNDDGINDLFFPMDGGDVEEIITWQIFNRWGDLVFEQRNLSTNDTSTAWRGKWNGKTASQGVYVWFMEVRYRDGFEQTLSGEVHLLR